MNNFTAINLIEREKALFAVTTELLPVFYAWHKAYGSRQIPLWILFDFCSSLFIPPAPITNVEAIEGQQAHLYCPMTTPNSDKINMVLWFKDDVGVPIYRYKNMKAFGRKKQKILINIFLIQF